MAVSPALKSLTLTAFRGSAATFKIEFEKNKKLTLIYGENGTGKTTICDAFEFLVEGRIGSLEDRGMGSSLAKFWPTAGKRSTELSVCLETSTSTYSRKMAGNKAAALIPSQANLNIQLLRRQQILKLIEEAPAKRYEAMKRFIDIEDFERSEQSLRQLVTSLDAEKKQARELEQESLGALNDIYERVDKPAELNPVAWAKRKLSAPTTDLTAHITAIGKLRTNFEALKTYPDRLETRQKAVQEAQTAAGLADQGQRVALAALGEHAADHLSVLEAGDAYLEKHPNTDSCPLCASPDNIVGLSAAIKTRLDQLEILRTVTAECLKQHAILEKTRQALRQTVEEYLAVETAFAASKTHSWPINIHFPVTIPPKDTTKLPEWLTANATFAARWAEVEAEWRDESKALDHLASALNRYETNAKRVQELTLLLPKVEEALNHCQAERQKFTDGIITEIAQQVGRLYEKLHPGEGLDKITLQLDPKKRASLDLSAGFSNHNAPPPAYFSQSHLDTLGLCVFLALAGRDQAAETVLILDDVLGSVDEPHVERVIGMIYNISAQFQHTIVTTHYRPWREKYRWGLLKPDQACQFVELTEWSLSDGLVLGKSIPDIERLRALLSMPSPDVQALCAKAGVILEWLLDFITLTYGCALPRRPGGNYTLGDLLSGVNDKLLAALKIEIPDRGANASSPPQIILLGPILEELKTIANIRNVLGAHYSASAFDLPLNDGIRFARQVEQLANAMHCPNHGLPNRDKSGSYWNNGGDTRRLHPLKKPG